MALYKNEVQNLQKSFKINSVHLSCSVLKRWKYNGLKIHAIIAADCKGAKKALNNMVYS